MKARATRTIVDRLKKKLFEAKHLSDFLVESGDLPPQAMVDISKWWRAVNELNDSVEYEKKKPGSHK